MNLSRPLTDLAPLELEHITYDLLRSTGMKNLSWRTPGPDGGRDLEGEITRVDFSGSYVTEKWFIECKKYAGSVDWPTVWNKISYADSALADYLLLVTTSSLSPQCTDQVEKWNNVNRRPAVRAWGNHEIVYRLQQRPEILAKFGLTVASELAPIAVGPLAMHLAKMAMAANSSFQFLGSPGGYLEAAGALAELLTVRVEDIERVGHLAMRTTPVIGRNDDDSESLSAGGPVDLPAINALRAVLSLVTASASVEIKPIERGVFMLTPTDAHRAVPSAAEDLYALIAHWGDMEVARDGDGIIVRTRPPTE